MRNILRKKCDLILGSIPAFAWRDPENAQNISVRIAQNVSVRISDGLILGSIPAFAWRDRENAQNISVRIVQNVSGYPISGPRSEAGTSRIQSRNSDHSNLDVQ
jgi:hypothetical protein